MTKIKVLSWIAEVIGIVIALDWTGISPKYGSLIFFAAALAKDTVNRIGDYLDNKIMDNSFPPKPGATTP